MGASAPWLAVSLAVLIALALAGGGADSSGVDSASPSDSAAGTSKRLLSRAYAKLPLTFEKNVGQADRRVRYSSRGPGYGLFLTSTQAVLSLAGPPIRPTDLKTRLSRAAVPRRRATVAMRLVGANRHSTIKGGGRQAGTSNYFIGDDRKAWRTSVPSFARVKYEDVWPKTDVIYYGKRGRLEYDFVLAPGADPSRIELDFQGAKRLRITRRGELMLDVGTGRPVRQLPPVIYQQVGGARRAVSGRWVLTGGKRAGFSLGAYDRGKTLVIDPTLSYSTYIGGSRDDFGVGIAADGQGGAYVTGFSYSADFPVKNALGNKSAGEDDAFVTKFSTGASGAASLDYSTYLGGSGSDLGADVEVDSSGSAYVTGGTESGDFPTKNAAQGNQAGGTGGDAFVAKLDPSGSSLEYASYLGGAEFDFGADIAVESDDAYVSGSTASPDFPTKNAFEVHRGGQDAFVAKVDTGASGAASLTYSTYLGGSDQDAGKGIAVEGGNAYVAGYTDSADFPTQNPFQGDQGGRDGFVSKLAPDGSALSYSTYLGGDGPDDLGGRGFGGGAIAVQAGSAYVTGSTESNDFPTKDAVQSTRGSSGFGLTDAFVSKLTNEGSALAYSTYLGGSKKDFGEGIAVDSTGSAYLTGATESSDFPTKNAFQPRYEGGFGDAFVAKLGVPGSALAYSSYLGGTSIDSAESIALDPDGSAYLTGWTLSEDFPVPGDAFQSEAAGSRPNTDAFVTKIEPPDSAPPVVTGIDPGGGPPAGGTSVAITGTGFAGASEVRFGATAAQRFTVESDTRITAVSPPHAEEPVDVAVIRDGLASAPGARARFLYAEGSWRATAPTRTGSPGQRATLLMGGKVLLTDGTSAEVYDPARESWTRSGDLNIARRRHESESGSSPSFTTTLLAGPACRATSPPAWCGRVLVVGGKGGDGSLLASAELYDPEADGGKGAWRSCDASTASAVCPGPLGRGRALHSATLLADGTVLVLGGCRDAGQCADRPGYETIGSAELYDPATGRWRATRTQPAFERAFHTATLLEDGEVLFVGGLAGRNDHVTQNLAAPEFYDSATETFQERAPRGPSSRFSHSATRLTDGRVLVAGGATSIGHGSLGQRSAELHQPSGVSTAIGAMRRGREGHTATLLPGGKVLIAGGCCRRAGFLEAGNGIHDSAEIFDPRPDDGGSGWSATRAMIAPRRGHTATLLSSDPVRFESSGSACGDNCGKVLVLGGSSDSSAELYTPAPSITGITPGQGPAAGGTEVTVEGTGFTHAVREVRFGDTPAQSFRIDSYSKLTAVSPPSVAGASVPVTVVNEGGAAGSRSRFSYTSAVVTAPGSGGPQTGGGDSLGPARVSEARRKRGLRRCLAGVARRAKRERGLARRAPARRRAAARRKARRRASSGRRRCLKRYGRTPGKVRGLTARSVRGLTPRSVFKTNVVLSFRAPGTDRSRPPAARAYLVKQSLSPISTRRAFRRAQTLCNGSCSFAITRVGTPLTLTVTGLIPRTTYYYAIAARDNVSGRLGPRSRTVRVRTK